MAQDRPTSAVPPSSEAACPSPGQIWRRALSVLCHRLEAAGLTHDRAIEVSEAAIITCALRHVPMSVEEALELAFCTAANACRLSA